MNLFKNTIKKIKKIDTYIEDNSIANIHLVIGKEDLGDNLCKYCPLENKWVYGADGGYMDGCEGSRCENAYENYLDEFD